MHSGTLLAVVLPALFLILASCDGLGGGQDGKLLVGTGGFTTIQKGTNGIVVLQSSRTVITGNVIKDNTDGGIYLYTRNVEETPSRSTITENTITNNTSSVGGGIMLSYLAEATIEKNTISGNTATDTNHAGWRGGGMYFTAGQVFGEDTTTDDAGNDIYIKE